MTPRTRGGSEAGPYTDLAAIYDAVMRDVAYDAWVEYVERICSRHSLRPAAVLDVACGTGNSTFPFAERGYRVAGVDSSAAMLRVARAKAAAKGLDVEFAQQDMRDLRPEKLRLGPSFDLVVCLYDSLNYLTDPHDLGPCFDGVFRALRPGGLFVFDVNSARRLSQMAETSLFLEGPGWAFVEQNEYDPRSAIWEIRVTGFIRRSSGLYKRFREVHRERAYGETELRPALARAGFQTLAAYNAFGFEPASADAARIYFVARRPSPGGGRPGGRRAEAAGRPGARCLGPG